MQFVMEKLNDIISTGEYVDEELNSIPQQSSCGIMNNIQVSYSIISMEEAGNGLAISLTKYYSEIGDPNHMFVQTQDFHINTNLNSYPKVNQLCHFCWEDISDDRGHLDMNHPASFCDPERYHMPHDLETHFKVRNLRNTSCPEKGCDATHCMT